MSDRYIDFDAAIEEAAEQPVVVRYLGKDWTLYTGMPGKPVLRLLRLQAEGRSEEELGRDELVTFMAEMVPSEVLDQWLEGGLTVDQMAVLLKRIMGAYQGENGKAETGSAEGKASKTKARRPSSSTSRR